MKTIIEENGYRITTFPSGAELRELISTSTPEAPEETEPQLTQLDELQNDVNFIILKLKGLI